MPTLNLTMKDVMSQAPITVNAEQTLKFALDRMQEHGIRHLPVLKGGQVLGLLSERDIRFIESYESLDSNTLKIEDAFTEGAYFVSPSTPVSRVCHEMAERKISSTLVMDQAELVGIFTWIDALKVLAKASN